MRPRTLPLLLALLLTAGCQSTQVTPSPASSSISKEAASSSTLQPEASAPTDPLTGLASDPAHQTARPVAVMLNTAKGALPQSGNAEADLYYELPEEGGVTRIMAVYHDLSQVGKLGPIRSTRPYYVELANALGATLIHAGGSGAGYDALEDLHVPHADALGQEAGLFYRDQHRLDSGYAMEHTLYTRGEKLLDWLEEGQKSGKPEQFHPFSDQPAKEGAAAVRIVVPFSGYKSTVFDYDPVLGEYQVSCFDDQYVDEAVCRQISVTNVLVLQTDVHPIPEDKAGRVAIALTGSGTGLLARDGKAIPIHWEKETSAQPYTFTDEAGQEVPLGTGKSYVCILGAEKQIEVN